MVEALPKVRDGEDKKSESTTGSVADGLRKQSRSSTPRDVAQAAKAMGAGTSLNDGVTIDGLQEGSNGKGSRYGGIALLSERAPGREGVLEQAKAGEQAVQAPDSAARAAQDKKLDTAVSKLGSQKPEERKEAKKELQEAGVSGLEALLRTQAFNSGDQKIQTTAREIVNENIKAYLRNNPDGDFSQVLKEWNDQTKGLPPALIADMPRGLLEFANLVSHPAVKSDKQPPDKSAQELGVLVKAIGESVTNMGSYHGDTDQTVAAALPYLPNLKKLKLGDSDVDPPRITAEALKSVSSLKQLERLSLNHLGLKGDELKTIEGMDSLKSLLLENDPVTDASVASLKKLKGLEGLALERTQVSADGFRELSQAKNFKALVLSGQNVTDEWLGSIGNMTNLNNVQVNDAAITDDGLRHLSGPKGLSWLNLNGNDRLTDRALETIAKLPVSKLEMVAPKITDSPKNASLLGGMTNLSELDIRGSEEFKLRIEETRKSKNLPECEIHLVEPDRKPEPAAG
jgi:hypothetical protein